METGFGDLYDPNMVQTDEAVQALEMEEEPKYTVVEECSVTMSMTRDFQWMISKLKMMSRLGTEEEESALKLLQFCQEERPAGTSLFITDQRYHCRPPPTNCAA